ncbi:response regulator transcription factor [Amphibacillus sp. Q70]|uniref:response regulator transcription factor n=1 Tax=Amphibacillus sp. Q70 TaxID=3453416 RepID=UPI003F858160
MVIGRKIKRKHPDIPLIFLTGFDLPEYRLQAKKMNADGFLNKSMKPDDLRDALQTIIKTGSSPIESEITILTKQEKRVLVLLSKGYTQNYIASELSVSRRTINNHVQAIHEKMQVNTSIEAISEGIKLGIISLLDN